MNIINQKKFKTTASHQLYELETKVDKFITLEFFRKEHEDLQRKIHEIVDTKLGQMALKVHGYNESTKAEIEEFKN